MATTPTIRGSERSSHRSSHRNGAMTDLQLGPIECWVKGRIATGVARFVITSTLPVVVASAGMTLLGMSLVGGMEDPEIWVVGLVMSTLIPMTLAPPILLYFARIVGLLDHASASLRVAAETDPLTSAKNRRGFFGALDQLDPRACNFDVAMIDLDDFKTLNDTNGHHFGDRALVLVAGWLTEAVGDAGLVGRLGGDEFACVAPAPNPIMAIQRQTFTLGGVEFSISIGHARSRPDRPLADSFLEADGELYRGKKARRRYASLPN